MTHSVNEVSRKDKIILGLALLATLLAFVASKTSVGAVLPFIASAAALSLVAMVVGEATDHLGAKMSPGATGVLQSAFGNLPELFVCIFSLRAGLVEVVKSALVGSILANSVLVLGLAIFFGGLKNGTQKFKSEPPKMISTLMLVATAALAIPTLAHILHLPAEKHENTLSLICSIVLLLIFGSSLTFFLRGDKAVTPQESHQGGWTTKFSILILVIAGIGAAFVSEWFVTALEPAMKSLGIPQAFAGLVIVAIAGNAIENVVGIQLMIKNKPDYGISVILNSSLQIALALVPLLVIISFFMGSTVLSLVLSPMLLVALLLAAIVAAFVVFDGESIWLEGVALIGLYAIIAAVFWWG